ncbi:flagellar basal body L-ring protein FlgH [Sphingomonas sp. LaA6.9]|uniref:flagellar basal body L-ring protein FlgH n=1 Tax=Sphingomonas sp. LaA6.9 TaxID=2919914 RepID=UPI001F4F97C2|nr:flagellar basal body L-ring protein FlgH [Sphingomonas sp. LaA6.9]MCJ8156331.1 flagellar basal body L-ring protein FlgH [Sphingomonas sp. LaA6.9]
MPTRRSSRRAAVALVTGLATVLFINAAEARKKDRVSEYAPSYAPAPVAAPVANGSIFQASQGYAPLTSGTRAAMVGDVLTIALVERTLASKSATQSGDRSGEIGLTPPTTGPLSFFEPSDVNMGGNMTFNGKGQATQSNALQGEISVTVAEVYPNGTMLVRGEKLVRLNRGDEFVQFSGLVRPTDISADNRVLSTRVADARINYTGKGEVARASQQGWLQRFFSRFSPF